MSKVRLGRVSEQIKKEMSQILTREIKDPRIGFVTVTGVELTGDMQMATIYISVMGNEEEKAETMKVLEKAKGFIRTEIGRRVKLRLTPEIQFKYDESIDYGQRIETILADLHRKENEK